MDKLLSDDELREVLAPFVYGERDLEKVISFIQSQKKAHADMVIGKDEIHQHWCGISCDEICHIANSIRAEQRERNK